MRSSADRQEKTGLRRLFPATGHAMVLLRPHPLHQGLHILGCRLDRRMFLAIAALRRPRGLGIGVALVLGRDVLERRANFLLSTASQLRQPLLLASVSCALAAPRTVLACRRIS